MHFDGQHPALQALCADCPQITRAFLASREGLVLATMGRGLPVDVADTAAAASSHLMDTVDADLTLLQSTRSREVLVWGDTALWYALRLHDLRVLLLQAHSDCHVGALRLAGKKAARYFNAQAEEEVLRLAEGAAP
jgi:predicted regulator of Ras-like GTPase activity (Roadblock/LC7/MglB family)